MRYLAAILMLIAMYSVSAAASIGPKGMWMVRDGRAKVKVDNCGETLCARIVWLQNPTDSNGQPLVDDNNADPAQRTRPIIGLPVAYDMVPSGTNTWSGVVYDPERGGAYKGTMELLADGQLKVTGCLNFLLCQSNYWSRIRR